MNILFVMDDHIIDPLGLGYLASYLKKAGHKASLANPTEAESVVRLGATDAIAFSVTTGMHRYYREMGQYFKSIRSNMISIFGGPHVTFFPKFALQDGVDIAVAGEGFEAVVDVANAWQNGENYRKVDNVVQADGTFELRPLLDKSTLLLPDREFMYRYPQNRANPIKNIMCSYQCVFSCAYCYSAKYKDLYHIKGADIRPVDSVIEEVEDVIQYPLELIFFQDDIFPLYKDNWLEEFVQEYKRFQIPFHIQTRLEYVNDERIKMLKSVGLHGVTFAVESGNGHLRKNVLRRRMDDDDIIKAANIIHKNDVKLRTENMIGIPGETLQTAVETLKLNAKCKPTIGWSSLFQPYPGTVLGDACIEDGLFDGDVDRIDRSFFEHQVLEHEDSQKFNRIHKLFALLVAHPFLIKFAGIFWNLKLDSLYSWFYKKYKTYLYEKKLYRVR